MGEFEAEFQLLTSNGLESYDTVHWTIGCLVFAKVLINLAFSATYIRYCSHACVI